MTDSLLHKQQIHTHPLEQLSYSAINTLHFCPRAFELSRMGSHTIGGALTTRRDTVHTGYGSAFGAGLQALLCGKSISYAIVQAIANYRFDKIYPIDAALAEKSLFHCIEALKKFNEKELAEITADWEPLTLPDGRPASEVGFAIRLPNGYYYRGFVDFILQNRKTKKLLTTEIKTSGANVIYESSYRMSLQGTVYAIIAEYIAHMMGIEADISCVYIIQATRLKRFDTFSFPKTPDTRIAFLRDTLSEVSIIGHYRERGGAFPKHGNCHGAFNSTCEFYGMCEIDYEYSANPTKVVDEVDFLIDYEALYQRQVDCLNADTRAKIAKEQPNNITYKGQEL